MGAEKPSLRPGDVVRSPRVPGIGLVLTVVDSGDPEPDWEVHVDWVDGDGNRDGAGVWRSDDLVIANDPASQAEAQQRGLR